jgi:peptidoglycan/LPS O-acetylase OafA/YrhL
MSFRAEKSRRWAVLLVGMALWAALPFAIVLNDVLASWPFLPDEFRNVLFFIGFALVFGIASQTRRMRLNVHEARQGVVFFGLFMLAALAAMVWRGLWFGPLTLLPPLLFFVVQTLAFLLGRWIGRSPRHKLPNPAAEA